MRFIFTFLLILMNYHVITSNFGCMTGSDQYCRQCSPTIGCTLCVNSFSIGGVCYPVFDNTLIGNCLSYLTPNTCASCVKGYYLQGNKCRSLPKGCATADANGFCISCISGYGLMTNGECSTSTSCSMMNCQQCGRLCYQCNPGFILEQGACILIPTSLPGCQEVRNLNRASCETCLDGYAINYNSGSCRYSKFAAVWACIRILTEMFVLSVFALA